MPLASETYRDIYRELMDLPENMVGEIIDGQLYTQPRPAPKHAVTSSSLGDEILGPYQKGRGGPGGWWIIDEPEIHLEGHVLVPDLAGWKKERMPHMPETAYFELAPDWVCEVLSPGTARKDRILKMPLYARFAVAHVWLIDPSLKTLETYELEKGFWKFIGAFADKDQVCIAPFVEITIDLEVLWSE